MTIEKMRDSSSLIYGNVLDDRYARLRFELCRDLIIPHLKKNSKILDIGCYTGDILTLLPKHVDYLGIDNDPNALKLAEARGAKTLKLDMENDPINLNQRFDIIICTELLEHMKDPEKLLIQINDLIKDDGVVVISLPNECTIYHRIKVLLGKGIDGTGFAPHYHMHFPTVNQSTEFIEQHFRIIKKAYWIHTDIGKRFKIIIFWIPDRFWMFLATLRPSLFARGVIFLCQKI